MDNFLLMNSPLQPAIIGSLYLAVVLKIGPMLMKNREAFDLKRILVVYNVSQIFFNAYLWTTNVSYLAKTGIFCHSPEEVDVELVTALLDVHHKYILLKIYDFLDTIFFVLRKKNKQVSFLHVYHHLMIFLFVWLVGKYLPLSEKFPPGPSLFYLFWNTLVHSVMYTYYLLSVVCGDYVKNVTWKKNVTLLQLVQHFSFLFLNIISLVDDRCPYPRNMVSCTLIFAITIIYLFVKFYRKTYSNNSQKTNHS